MLVNLLNNGYSPFITSEEMNSVLPEIESARVKLNNKSGLGSELTGWLTLPQDFDREVLKRIKLLSDKIRASCGKMFVVGIGGSYLGARAGIEFLRPPFRTRDDFGETDIIFAGHSFSGEYLNYITDLAQNCDFCVNVVSKSGNTTETQIAFEALKKIAEERFGASGARERIICTTGIGKGSLWETAVKEGYEILPIPDDIGGRYSVLSAAGLLPLAVAGADIEKILAGARVACEKYKDAGLEDNPCHRYAAVRNLLYRKGKRIEVFASYEPSLKVFIEWLKQLFGESEGKDGKGIFPTSVGYTTDLHSLGQYIQDGERSIFETVLWVEKDERDCVVAEGGGYLNAKSLHEIKRKAFEGTALAHISGGVPNLIISLPDRSEESLGHLIYFFEKACALSGYVLGVNPFDQPGVEKYKKNMFTLLGRPGFESGFDELQKMSDKLFGR